MSDRSPGTPETAEPVRRVRSMSAPGRLAAVALRCGVIVAVLFSILLAHDRGWRAGMPAGIAAGLAFAVMVFALEALWHVGARLAGRFPDRPSFRGEQLLRSGEARHLVGIDAVPGWLYLTDRALRFRSGSGGSAGEGRRIPLAEIRRADATRFLGLLANGLEVVTDRDAERFVTDDDPGWARAIASAREAADPESVRRAGPGDGQAPVRLP